MKCYSIHAYALRPGEHPDEIECLLCVSAAQAEWCEVCALPQIEDPLFGCLGCAPPLQAAG